MEPPEAKHEKTNKIYILFFFLLGHFSRPDRLKRSEHFLTFSAYSPADCLNSPADCLNSIENIIQSQRNN